MQWQMLVTGLDRALLAEARIDDTDDTCHGVRLEWVEADDLVQYDLVEMAEHMWTHVQDGTLPIPLTASSLPDVKQVNAVADPTAEVVDLTFEASFIRQYADLKDRQKELAAEIDVAEGVIRNRMGEATKGEAHGYKVSLSEPARKLTAEREAELLSEHPEYAKTVLDRERVKANRQGVV